MDDLTKIKGIGKATAKKLAAAGYDSVAALAAATTAPDLAALQDAGFFPADIEAWVKAAAELVATGPITDGAGADAADLNPPAAGDAGGLSSVDGETSPPTDAPADSEAPQGTNTPESAAGGDGDPAVPAQEPERRVFPVVSAVLHDGVVFAPGENVRVTLTSDQHVALRVAGAVVDAWEKGGPADA